LDLNIFASQAHLQFLRDFVFKRNFTLILKSTALDPLILRGPITKIFGQHLSTEDLDLEINQYGVYCRLNLFGPEYYTIETNLVNSHINNVTTLPVATNNLLRVIPCENKKPGLWTVFERMNDGGCLEVDDPTIDQITLTFRDHQGDYLLSLERFTVTLVLDYVILLIKKRKKNSSVWIK